MKSINDRLSLLEKRVGIKENEEVSLKEIFSNLPTFKSGPTGVWTWMRKHGFNDKKADSYSFEDYSEAAKEYYIGVEKTRKECAHFLSKFSKEKIIDALGRVHNLRRYTQVFKYTTEYDKDVLIKRLLDQIPSLDTEGALLYFKNWWSIKWNPIKKQFEEI